MTIRTISDSERDPSQSTDAAQSPTDAVVDRLAGLLRAEALEDALQGLAPDDITGPGGLLSQLAGRVIETALGTELTEHLGHPPGGVAQGPNVRNGAGRKSVHTDLGTVEIKTPRDRDGSFVPKLVGKRQTRLAGLDDKILGLYAGGMTVRDVSAHLSELYGVDVGRDTISRVTDAVLEDIAAWRTRPLDPVYAIVYFDALRVKVREDRSVQNRACYLALGVTCDGEREVLGIWWQETEGSKFWLAVLNDLRRRGVEDVLISCVDGLRGFPEAIEAVPAGLGADLHRAPHPRLAALRQLPRPQEGRLRPAPDLHRTQRRRRPLRARALRRRVGRTLPTDRERVARQLGARDPVPGVARQAAPRGLHDQHDRGPAPPDPQGDQDPRALPRRTGRDQAHLPRDRARRRQVAEEPDLDSAPRRPQDPLRRPIPRLTTTCRLGLTHSSSDSLDRDRPEQLLAAAGNDARDRGRL
jgi:putative transposase